jgi:hypothetical protein
VANAQWFHDVAGQHIEEVAQTLPSVAIDEAKALDERLNLWQNAAELIEELQTKE